MADAPSESVKPIITVNEDVGLKSCS
jgi:hypothetical protein